jgi:hypothetical protein
MTKSSGGAAFVANSLQSLLRSPSVGMRLALSQSSANELIFPVGWLPALYPRNPARPTEFRIDSARTLRAELPVHRNNTFNMRGDAAATTILYAQQLDFAPVASAGPQQAPWVPQACGAVSLPYTGTLPSVWNVSHATPAGSVTQYLSERA